MASQYTTELTAKTFESFVTQNPDKLLLIDFWAPWCGPCRTLGPMLERIVESYGGAVLLGKINTEQERQLAAAFQIQSIPFVLLIKDGQPVDNFVGAIPEPQIRAKINQYAEAKEEDPADQAKERIAGLIGAARWREAVTVCEGLLKKTDDPAAKTEMTVSYCRALVGAGRSADAKTAFSESGAVSSTIDRLFGADTLWTDSESLSPNGELLAPDGSYDKTRVKELLANAAAYARRGQGQNALELAIRALALDKVGHEQLTKRALLALFALIGEKSDLVREYRNRMATMLY